MFDSPVKSPTNFPKQPTGTDITINLSAALTGDSAAFELLIEPYRGEILTHCYRILGSLQDAEDLVQETFLRAWRRLSTYEGRASFRAWLYKIATNACLDALDRRPKRTLPQALYPAGDPHAPLPAPIIEPIWLEPFPDELLAPADSSPEVLFDAHESITLSFLVALQLLPPRQRSALILRCVLDWHVSEIAGMLGLTLSAVNSLLHRARLTLENNYPSHGRDSYKAALPDIKTKILLDRYVRAWESADIDEFTALLKEDATYPMPPFPLWLKGRSSIREFVAATLLAGEAHGRWRLQPIQANSMQGFAWYRLDETQKKYQAFAIQVLSLDEGLLSNITTFMNPSLFRFFKLPSELIASSQ